MQNEIKFFAFFLIETLLLKLNVIKGQVSGFQIIEKYTMKYDLSNSSSQLIDITETANPKSENESKSKDKVEENG